ncbi:SIMPL domain-containing protein [uncultured Gimesia sp.]|uniref:SIMPL domain-containing protein n=1 Tax=uncultured Gimesia sp. TaxID=1678688 RepID=UPI00261C38E8|nr:SIMPL domain-containing protein [uncultured Gimesia sp.]
MSNLAHLMQRMMFLTLIGCLSGNTNELTVFAAENNGISVIGVGKVEARPSVVELTGLIVGQGQLAGDAVTKFHGNRRRAEAAFKNLKIPGLEVVEDGMSLYSAMTASQMQAAMRGMAVNNTQAQELSVSESIKLRITGIEKLNTQELLETIVKIVDSGKDAGVIIGNKTQSIPGVYNPSAAKNTMATFKVINVQKLKEEAFQKAIADAKAQAEKLARLTGVKLGKVISINGESDSQNNSSGVYNPYIGRMISANNVTNSDEQATSLLKAIPISVAVRVTYAID